MSPFFRPWIGCSYQTDGLDGLRVMILGESHYGMPHEETADFTNLWVESYASNVKANRFFTIVTKLLLRVPTRTRLKPHDRRELWNRVAFYNYIQSFPASVPRVRPTPQLWQAAEAPFGHVLGALRPQFILILGNDLGKRVAPLIPETVASCIISHPASFGFKHAEWSDRVHRSLCATVD